MTEERTASTHHKEREHENAPDNMPGVTPAAGPHAKPKLTDPEKTPGAGSLPDPERPRDGDATTG